MAQHDYIISNQTFPNTRADINNLASAIATNNSGTSAPTTQYAGQFWIDTTSTTWTLYIHDGTDDIQFATIDTSANTVNFVDSALDVVTDTTPQLGGNLDLNSNDITGTGNINITGNITASGNLAGTLTTASQTNITSVGTLTGLTVNGNLSVDGGTIKLDGNYPVGTDNVALGNTALDSISSGSYNTAIGTNSMTQTSTGQFNVALGRNSLTLNTSGSENVSIGSTSLYYNTSGNKNVAVGIQALNNNTTADNNTAVGYFSLVNNTTGQANTAVGKDAGSSLTTSLSNTLIGTNAGSTITTGGKNTIIGRYNGNESGLDIRTSSNNIVLSDGDGNVRQYIDNSGRILVGTTSPFASSNAVLHINADAVATDAGSLMSECSGTGLVYHVHFRNGNGGVGGIGTNGSATTYATSSDYRLKENVVDIPNATERLKQLSPKRFNFIADADTTVDGFLAHEVSDIVPEAITGTKDEVDADGNPVYQGIDQSKLVPLLVATIKELEARITALEGA